MEASWSVAPMPKLFMMAGLAHPPCRKAGGINRPTPK